MARHQSALDWFTDTYCETCDNPNGVCSPNSVHQLACILAQILKALKEGKEGK